jgi:LysM repeat protein
LKVATSIAVNRETDNQSKSTTNTTPSQTEASTEKYKESQDHHRVKSGESLRSLAVEYGYTEDRFRWMNGLGATEDIYPGQILRTSDCVCPERTTATEKRPQPYDDTSRIVSGYASKGVSESAPEGTKVYVVREKDTLFSIAKAFNTSVDHLMSLNNLSKGEIILPSQRLYVQ